jgi:hypothetical protein
MFFSIPRSMLAFSQFGALICQEFENSQSKAGGWTQYPPYSARHCLVAQQMRAVSIPAASLSAVLKRVKTLQAENITMDLRVHGGFLLSFCSPSPLLCCPVLNDRRQFPQQA